MLLNFKLKKQLKHLPLYAISLLSLSLSCAYAQNTKLSEAEIAAAAKLGADSTLITPRMGIVSTRNAAPATNSTGTFHSTNTNPSIPKTNVYACSSYRGQYDIDHNAIGNMTITTEANPSRPNYGQIIATNTSGCYQPCTPTNVSSSEACTVTKGAHWLGTVNYNTYSSCSAGGYLQAGPRTYISDNCYPEPPSCVASSWGNSYACPSGYSGSITSTSYNTCPSGPYGANYQYEGPQTNSCVPPASTPPSPPVTCPKDHYSCEYFKPGFQKVYSNKYGPAPACTLTKTLYYMDVDDNALCDNEI